MSLPGPPTTGWRARDREWSLLAAAIVGVAALEMLWPGLDLIAAGLGHVPGQGFVANRWPLVQLVYGVVPWAGRGLVLLALLVAGARLLRPAWIAAPLARRFIALGLSMLLGAGVVVNGVLKEGWGRARPAAVQAFGGPAHFVPALRPSRECRSNCSFVSGHAATGFALGAVGLFGTAARRRRWRQIGIAAGLAIGALRVLQGAHFLSDILFCGLVMWACEGAIRACWLRAVARRRRRALPRGVHQRDQARADAEPQAVKAGGHSPG